VSASDSTDDGPRFVDAFRSPRLLAMIGLGYAAGLPNALLGSTMAAWLRIEEVSLTAIGFAGVVALPYTFKPLWAPLLDRWALFGRLGRRRGWILLFQLALVLGMGLLGSLQPRTQLPLLVVLATFLTFLAASQDIVVDAYRVELLPPHQHASGTAIYVATFRLALVVAGGGGLALAAFLPWSTVYAILGATIAVGLVTTALSPAGSRADEAPRSLREAVIEPLREYFGRRHALALLFAVGFYKVGDAVAGHFMNPFLLDQGYGLVVIAGAYKTFGLATTVVGSLLGGGFVARWGLKRALLVFGVGQAVANLLYMVLAASSPQTALLFLAVGADHLLNGMGTAAFVAFLMSLCSDRRYTASQYALLSAFMATPARLLNLGSGAVAERIGWPGFFLLTTLLAVPALAVIARVLPSREPEDGAPATF
jgi:PAT family beta-lactamase induction signal transducer AmpG